MWSPAPLPSFWESLSPAPGTRKGIADLWKRAEPCVSPPLSIRAAVCISTCVRGNYRPIALLTSTYQLINIILADRLQTLAERHRLFESSQFGFRWLTGVTSSVQKQNWLLKLAKTGDGTLIRIDLDYRNAFNAAGHSCLWSILEKFGVPDISLPYCLKPPNSKLTLH